MESEVELLVAAAGQGNKRALEELILTIQDKIYALALRMLYDPSDAQDSAQEILLKIVTHLGTFKAESSFSTWMYRVAANHLLTVRKRRAESQACSFEQYQEALDRDKAVGWQEPHSDIFQHLLLEEIRSSCLQGLLLCLDRDHRLAYLLADVFDVNGDQGAAILEVSAQVFRKRLSRARQRLRDFMITNCSLVNPSSPCRCEHFLSSYANRGVPDKSRLLFAGHPSRWGREENLLKFLAELDELQRIAFLHKRYPDRHPPEVLIENIRDLLKSGKYQLLQQNEKEKNMEKMISFCGLNCAECPTFLATLENSDEKRKQVAEQWSKQFGLEFAVKDIDCEGCLSKNGRLFGYCSKCKIRQCCGEKEVENCAGCDDYSCQKLDEFFRAAPQAKTNLDAMRKSGLDPFKGS